MNENYKDVNGTVLLCPPDGMEFLDIRKIMRAVTDVTGIEGGYEMSVTPSGTMMFYHMSENEADELLDLLRSEFGEDAAEMLAYAYDDFDDLGVVCQGCWKDISPDEVYYDDEDNPYCEECYDRIVKE